jgi:ribosomal protein L29
MKTNKIKDEFKQLEPKGLMLKLDAVRRDLFSLRLNSSTSHVKDYSQFRKNRKNIARLLTFLGQKGNK